MFGNYFKTAFRSILKRKLFSFINIAGLALGIAISFIILLFVWNEISYDRFHKDPGRIHRLTVRIEMYDKIMAVPFAPGPLAPLLESRIPEIADVVRMKSRPFGPVSVNGASFEAPEILYAEPGFFNLFTVSIVQGDRRTMLEAPYSLVLTDETARKWFGRENPLGKSVRAGTRGLFTVTGVVKKMPENSHLKFDQMASLATLEKVATDLESWTSYNYFTYFRVAEGTPIPELTRKCRSLLATHAPESAKGPANKMTLMIQPMLDVHLRSSMPRELEPAGNPGLVRLLFLIAVFILLIACINFVNLSTAHAAQRAKEVGLRKILGAGRQRLAIQFLGESMVLSVLSLGLALGLIGLLLPVFNSLIVRRLSLDLLSGGGVLFVLGGIVLLVGLGGGLYPAMVLSSYGPLEALKSRHKAGRAHGFLRSGLVTFQYIISTALICGTLTIQAQLRFARDYDLGFDKDNLIEIRLDGETARRSEAFRNEVLRLPGVFKGGRGDPLLGINRTAFGFEGRGEDRQIMPHMGIDPEFVEALDLKLAAGRNFSADRAADADAVLINETLASQLGWKEPLGKTVIMGRADQQGRYAPVAHTVIGVVRDFHFSSLREELSGFVFHRPEAAEALFLRVMPQGLSDTLGAVERIWKKIEPAKSMNFAFVDENFDRLYRTEMRLGGIFIGLTLIAVFVAALGLLGLASFAAEQRTKEIGIRKVLGASVPGLIAYLSGDFVKWVVLANVVAWPVAYLGMGRWLQTFAYRIPMRPWIFLAAGGMAAGIALLTTSARIVRAASIDPVRSLRYE